MRERGALVLKALARKERLPPQEHLERGIKICYYPIKRKEKKEKI